jgi:hypothetical protein
MPSDAYQERVLNAPDTCSNCLRLIRVERERPARKWRPAESHYARNQATTSVEYVPADVVSETEQVFCACGAGSAFDRVWSWDDVDRERFRTLLKRLLRSMERKGLQLARRPAAAHGLTAYDDATRGDWHGPWRESAEPTGCIDEALSAALEAGLRAQATASRPTETA